MKQLLFILLLFASLRSAAQSCTGASSITSTGTDHNSTTITWDSEEDVLNYVIVYYTNPLAKTRQTVNDPGGPYPDATSGPLSGLTPSTSYSYYVVTKCNAGDSVVSSVQSFTTTAAPCNAVTGLTVSPLTSTTAYVYATAYQYATSYTLKYVKQGQIDTVTVGPSVNPTWQLTNLLSNTTYAYRIASTCPAGTNSASSTFTTAQQATKYTPMLSGGYEFKRGEFDSTLGIPTGTVPGLRGGKDSSFALFYDSSGKVLYGYDPPTQTWNSVTGCTTTFDTYSDSTGGPVTGETTWTPEIDAIALLVDRAILVLIRNAIPLTEDVDYTFDPETGEITLTDTVLAEETFSLTYSCGSSGSTNTGVVTYVPQQFTDGATITINYLQGSNWYGTIAGDRALVISNMSPGKYITIKVTQGSGGSHTLSLPAGSKILNGQGSGITPVLSSTAAQYDILTGYMDEGNVINWVIGLDYQ
jgi:hypothetical protein